MASDLPEPSEAPSSSSSNPSLGVSPTSTSKLKPFSTGKLAAATVPLTSPPPTLDDLYREQAQTRRLLSQHIETSMEERRAAKLRHDALMEILKDVLARLP